MFKTMKKVTISFPVYNVKDTVKKSLLSMLNQSYENIEFLIIDDRGTDNSIDIVNEIVNQHVRKNQVRFIEHNRNLGLGSVRNTSIHYATGDYLYFMDSDDELLTDCISILVNEMLVYNADFVVGNAQIDINGTHSNIIGFNKKHIWDFDNPLINDVFINGLKFPVYMWNKLFDVSFLRRHDIKCIHPYVEDDIFTFKTILFSEKCIAIPTITYIYKINNQSITQTLMKKDIPLNTANIYVDIFNYKKEIAASISHNKLRQNVLLEIINFAILRSSTIVDSHKISETDKKKLISQLLDYPFIKICMINKYRWIAKGILINLLKLNPYPLKLKLISITNRFRVHDQIS